MKKDNHPTWWEMQLTGLIGGLLGGLMMAGLIWYAGIQGGLV
jgi:hypothetical protein